MQGLNAAWPNLVNRGGDEGITAASQPLPGQLLHTCSLGLPRPAPDGFSSCLLCLWPPYDSCSCGQAAKAVLHAAAGCILGNDDCDIVHNFPQLHLQSTAE